MIIDISVGSALKVSGYNPEAADLCNPAGAIYSESYYVTARIEGGDVEYAHYHLFDDEADAAALANKVRYAAWKNGWTPVGNQYWSARKIYGAASWNADDEDGLVDDEERDRRFRGV